MGATRRLLLFGLIFSPWAAASEPPWAFWTVNCLGFLLFLIQAARWLDRRENAGSALDEVPSLDRWVGFSLGGLVTLVLLWCLVSALNACGRVDLAGGKWIATEPFVPWLPHSFDGPATWGAFFHGIALAGFFWGARNWFIDRALSEGSSAGVEGAPLDPHRKRRRSKSLPEPIHQLLWTLAISGSLLTLVAMIQRTLGTDRLLGIFVDPLGRDGQVHFGPFAYRNNAAQYLGLIWPLALGLWLFGRHHRRRLVGGPVRVGGSPRVVLVLCGLVMLGGVVGSLSRGGWALAVVTAVVVTGVVLAKWLPKNPQWTVAGVGVAVALFAGLFWVAWPTVESRFQAEFYALPLDRPQGLEEFTLAGTLDLKGASGKGGFLMGLSSIRRGISGLPRAVYLGLQEDGRLVLRAWNEERRMCCNAEVPGFWERFRGSRVEFAIVSREGLRLFANHQLLAFVEPGGTNKVAWPPRFSGDYVKNGGRYGGRGRPREGIDRMVVWERAITPQQVSAWLAGRGEAEGVPAPLLDFDYAGLGLRPLLWTKEGTLFSRDTVWASAFEMARLAGWPRGLGGGPGAYPGSYAISPARLEGLRELHVHNDYLEFLLTFGVPGSLLLLAALAIVLGRPLLKGGIRMPVGFIILLWTALLGCLAFAFLDWPLFAPAVQVIFVVLCAILSATSIRRKHRSRREERNYDEVEDLGPASEATF